MLINRIIGPRDYELIRNRIGEILANELLSQEAQTYDELFLAPVFVQRSKPINSEECPLINVRVDDGAFSDQTMISSRGNYTFYIDVVTNTPSSDAGRGDILSAYDAQKLAGVCQGILMDPIYKTLGFAPPFIERSKVTAFSTGFIERGDSTDLTVVRITVNVQATQKEPGISATPLSVVFTDMHLNETENGLVFIFNA